MGLNILLVDSDAEFTNNTGRALRGEGHQVFIACDAMRATMLARELRPDVVLLELNLPDADGYEVARALRSHLPTTTPIIVITGARDANLADELDLILNKPIPIELFGGLLEYIRRRRWHMVTTRPAR